VIISVSFQLVGVGGGSSKCMKAVCIQQWRWLCRAT